MKDDQDHYRSRRFQVPRGDLKYVSRYQFDSNEMQQINQDKLIVVSSVVLDLTTAQTFLNPFIINEPGRAVVIYGIDTSAGGAAYDPTTNAGVEPVKSSAFVFARFNQADSSLTAQQGTALKHNRGFYGTFQSVFLSWPTQANTKARLVIYKWDSRPWISGEAAT